MLKDSTEKLIKALQALDKIDDFSYSDQARYVNAIEAYQAFIKDYLKETLTALNIHPQKDFYGYDLFTCAELKQDDDLSSQLATYLVNITKDTKDTEDDLKRKLAQVVQVVSSLLDDEKGRASLIQGIAKLEWLLSLSNQELPWGTSIINFNADLKSGRNAFVDFLMTSTAQSVGLDQKKIGDDLALKGSKRQQAFIEAMKLECQGYLNYLDKKKRQVNQTEPGLAKKHQATTSLIDILSHDETPASKKIETFASTFNESKKTLNQHRDGTTLLFLKRTAYLLSSFLLGAGLIYSYVRNGTCNFFKSKGELFTDKVEARLHL